MIKVHRHETEPHAFRTDVTKPADQCRVARQCENIRCQVTVFQYTHKGSLSDLKFPSQVSRTRLAQMGLTVYSILASIWIEPAALHEGANSERALYAKDVLYRMQSMLFRH